MTLIGKRISRNSKPKGG